MRRGLTGRPLWRRLWRESLSPQPSLLRPPSLPRLPPGPASGCASRLDAPQPATRAPGPAGLLSSGRPLSVTVHLMAAPVRRRGPVGVFNALFGAASLPTSLREGMADYNLVKCYVLLHDLTTGPANSQAATDGLQVALQRPPLWRALRRTHAMRAPCSPRGVGAPKLRPTARPPRPPLPPLSIAAPALHRCRLSPSLPPLSSAAGDLARLRPRGVQAAADQLARRRRAAAARPVDGRTATRDQPLRRRAPSARRGARRAALGRGHGAGAHPGPRARPPSPTPALDAGP